MAAYKAGASVTYVHQDHLTGTSLTTNDSGTEIGAIKYTPFGAARSFSGTLPAQKFTGQRLDDVGLYYYGARYYDPEIGRFISPDTIVPKLKNPQALNRYSYVTNNPLKYTDPTGRSTQNNLNPGQGSGGGISWDDWVKAVNASGDEGGGTDTKAQPSSTPLLFGTGPFEENKKDDDTKKEPTMPVARSPSPPVMRAAEPADPEDAVKMEKGTETKPGKLHEEPRKIHETEVVIDTVAVAGDLLIIVPPAAGPGYVVSVIASGVGTLRTIDNYYNGKASERDVTISILTFISGLLPVVGIFPALYQLAYDSGSLSNRGY